MANDLTIQKWQSVEEMHQQCKRNPFEMGRLLCELKEECPHGEFTKLTKKYTTLSEQSIRKLMSIHKCEFLKRAQGRVLPHSWRTLSELAKLDEGEFEYGVDNGWIDEETTRKDVQEFKLHLEDLTKPDEPEVDEPEVDEPEVDEPEVDEPEVDEPEVDEPEVDEPEVDEPEVDEPEVDEQRKRQEFEEKHAKFVRTLGANHNMNKRAAMAKLKPELKASSVEDRVSWLLENRLSTTLSKSQAAYIFGMHELYYNCDCLRILAKAFQTKFHPDKTGGDAIKSKLINEALKLLNC